MKFWYRVGLTLASVLVLVLSLFVAKWGQSWASIGEIYVLRCALPLVSLSAIVSLGFGLLSRPQVALATSPNASFCRTRNAVLDASALFICLAAWLISPAQRSVHAGAQKQIPVSNAFSRIRCTGIPAGFLAERQYPFATRPRRAAGTVDLGGQYT